MENDSKISYKTNYLAEVSREKQNIESGGGTESNGKKELRDPIVQ